MSDKKRTKQARSNVRVLLVRNAYAAEMGGAEVFTYNLAYELQQNDIYTLVSTSQKTLRRKCDQAQIKITASMWAGWLQRLSGLRGLLLIAWLPYLILRALLFAVIIVRHKITIIHVGSRDDFIAGTWAANLTGIRLIWTDHADLKHNFSNHDKWYKNIPGKMVYACAKQSHCPITVVSKSELDAIIKQVGQGLHTQLQVVHNGVMDRIGDFPHPPSDGTIRLGFVGRLVRDKGVYELFEAYETLAAKNPKLELTVVGDGPARQELETRKLPRVTFTGYTDKPLRHMSNFDIFVYPTYHEGLSLSLLEACMMQRCIITTRVGGNPEIITDGEHGLLVPARDTGQLAAALERCIRSPKLRELLAKNARQRYLQEFEFSAIVKTSFMELYTNETTG